MVKAKSLHSCTECGATSPKWQGQCPGCDQWNTLVETVAEVTTAAGKRFGMNYAPVSGMAAGGKPQALSAIRPRAEPRLPTGIEEFDRVLGGGIVAGGVVLIGGDPGIGKSTLLLQALARLAESGQPVLYVSGEESAEQVALRAQRLQLPATEGLRLLPEINLEKVLAALQQEISTSTKSPDGDPPPTGGRKLLGRPGEFPTPLVAVIDSIQTLWSDALQSAPGSVAQVRECAAQLTRFAKQTGTCIFLVGHVTKEGTLAGPRVLEHIVDTVLYFEGDTHSSFRLVRAFKNRFGAVNELGVFAMTDKGLKGVSNPSALFLSQHAQDVAGSCVLVTQEGTRPLLVEIQALVDTAQSGNPRRLTVGLDPQRLAMLLAVLHRHAGVMCGDQDVFVNAVGGVRIQEPAADLAVLLAIVSSLRNQPLPGKWVAFGEIGLAGEIRPAPRGQERLKEAAKLGFTHALIPQANAPRQALPGIEVIALERIEQAIEHMRTW